MEYGVEIGFCHDCRHFDREKETIKLFADGKVRYKYKKEKYGYCELVVLFPNMIHNGDFDCILHHEYDADYSLDDVCVGENFGCIHFNKKDGK